MLQCYSFSLGAIPFSCSFHRPPQTSAGLPFLLRASRSPALVYCCAIEAALFASSRAIKVACSIYRRAVKVVRSVDCRAVEAALSDSSRAIKKRALFIVAPLTLRTQLIVAPLRPCSLLHVVVEVAYSIYCCAVKVAHSVDCRTVKAVLSDSSGAVEKHALFIIVPSTLHAQLIVVPLGLRPLFQVVVEVPTEMCSCFQGLYLETDNCFPTSRDIIFSQSHVH